MKTSLFAVAAFAILAFAAVAEDHHPGPTFLIKGVTYGLQYALTNEVVTANNLPRTVKILESAGGSWFRIQRDDGIGGEMYLNFQTVAMATVQPSPK